MMISREINNIKLSIESSDSNPYSSSNNILFLDFIFNLLQKEPKGRVNIQNIEEFSFDLDIDASKELRLQSLNFWNIVGIKKINSGGRFLNDYFLYFHNLWLIQNKEKRKQSSPYYPIVLIMERGGYIWKYKGQYHVGEKPISIKYFIENNLLFCLPSYNYNFLNYIDLQVDGAKILDKKSIDLLYDKWKKISNQA